MFIEHCKPKIRFLIRKKKAVCRAVWRHLRHFLDISGKPLINGELSSEIERFFAMFESSNENEWNIFDCCKLTNIIRSKYKEDLSYVDSVSKPLYHNLRNLRSTKQATTTTLSPQMLSAVEELEAMLIHEYKTTGTYAEPLLSSLRASEELDLTTDDANTSFALLRLL